MVLLTQQVAMRALGFDVPKAELIKIIRDNDQDGRKLVRFQDFREISRVSCGYRLITSGAKNIREGSFGRDTTGVCSF